MYIILKSENYIPMLKIIFNIYNLFHIIYFNYNMLLYLHEHVYKNILYPVLTNGLGQGDQMVHQCHFHFCDKLILPILTHLSKIS